MSDPAPVPPVPPVDHLTPAAFANHGAQILAYINAYWASLQSDAAPPVLSRSKPGDTLAALPTSAPETPEPFASVLADLDRVVMPGLTHWQSPSFFAFFPANTSGPSVLADLLCAGLGVQGMLWATSPAATELETRMLDWMADALGLPDRFKSTSPSGGGVIQSTASEATLVALCAARTRARTADGTARQPLIAYTSTQAHSSVIKAAMIAGLIDSPNPRDGFIESPHGGVRLIDTDAQHRLDPAALERAIQSDLAAGRRPFFVTATLGTTSSMAIDDLDAIARICRQHNIWLHVDAAFAGAALICPEHRAMLGSARPEDRGIDLADSFCFNPHKWLLVGFDCDLFYTADRRAVIGALSVTPEYLRNTASDAGEVWDYRDWQIPLGRRFRALKLWFVLRHYGLAQLRTYIREHVRLGELFESLVRADPRFEIAAPRGLSLVCFRLKESGDHKNRDLLARLNATGKLYLTHTVLPGGTYVLRMAIGATFTREEHVCAAWELIAAMASRLG